MDIRIGTVLDGFELLQLLGRGGMGEVYLARDLNLNRKVALKVLSKALLDRPSIVKRFNMEMQVLAKMQHPNIVKIFTFGVIDDVHYFVQEYVNGRNVEELLEDEGVFDEEETLRLTRELAEAFIHYHPLGVIHRDLKPANIMRDEKKVYKIMDFGLVRDDEETRLTDTGGIVGTLAYIPPDVLSGNEPTAQLDVYQLGCILYEVLTGQMVMYDRKFLRAGFKKLSARLIELPDLPKLKNKRLEQVIRKCLHPDPRIRFQSGEEVLRALEKGAPTVNVQKVEQKEPLSAQSSLQKTFALSASALLLLFLLLTVFPRNHGQSELGRQSYKIKLRSPIEFNRSSIISGRTLTLNFGLNSPAPVAVFLNGLNSRTWTESENREHSIDIKIQQHINFSQKLFCRLEAANEQLFAGDLPLGPKVLFTGFRSNNSKSTDERPQHNDYRSLNDLAFPRRITCGPIVLGSYAFLGDRNGFVYCINTDKGKRPLQWAYRLPFAGGLRNPRPKAIIGQKNGTVAIVADDGKSVYSFFLAPDFRTKSWQEGIKESQSELEFADSASWAFLSSEFGEKKRLLVTGPQANRHSAPYTVTRDGRVLVVDLWLKMLHLLDTAQKGVVWSHRLGKKTTSTGAANVDDKYAYIVVRGKDGFDELQSISLVDGEKRWECRLWAGLTEIRPTTPLVTASGAIYIFSGNYLFCLHKDRHRDLKLELQDGVEWKYRFSGFPTGRPIYENHRLSFFLAEGGRIAVLGKQGIHLKMNICSVKVDSKGIRGLKKLKIAEYEIPSLVERDVLIPKSYKGNLVFAYGEHVFTVRMKDMQLLCKDPIMGQATTQPAVAGNSLIFATIGGHLYTMDVSAK